MIVLTCILRKVNSIYSNNCDCEWIRNNRTKDKSISSRFAQFCYDRLYIFIYLYRQEFSSKIIAHCVFYVNSYIRATVFANGFES